MSDTSPTVVVFTTEFDPPLVAKNNETMYFTSEITIDANGGITHYEMTWLGTQQAFEFQR